MTEKEKRMLDKLKESKKRVMQSDSRFTELIACATKGQSPKTVDYWMGFIIEAYSLGVDVGVVTGINLAKVMDAEIGTPSPQGKKNQYQ